MKLSVWSSYYHPLAPEDMVTRFLEHGIFCTELSDEHGAQLFSRGADVKKTGELFADFISARGFEITQGHLPLSTRICSADLTKLCQWIDMYEAIGIKNMVLHCDNLTETLLTREEKIEKNSEKLRELAKYIEGRDITICLENLRPRSPAETDLIDKSADDLLHIITLVGSERFGICLDTGHLNLTVKGHRDFILKAGKRLKALHITDNDGTSDQHLMPFNRGCIDFPNIIKTLREIGYEGIFNFEIPGESGIPMELRDAKLSYIKAAYSYLMHL